MILHGMCPSHSLSQSYPVARAIHPLFFCGSINHVCRMDPNSSLTNRPPELLMLIIFSVHHPLNCRQQSLKSKMPSGLLRKLTTKLKPPTVHQRSANSAIISPPNSPPTKRSAVPAASTDAAAIERRRAALQQCGLVPLQRKDLSQLEHELDQRFSQLVIPPQDQPEQGELSTAEKIRREWQAKNETQPQKQGHDLGPKVVPNDVGSGSLDPEPLGKSDLTSNAEQEKSITPAPPHVLLNPTNPISLSSIPATLLFPDIPEEDDPEPENEKVCHLVFLWPLPPVDR